MSKRSLLAAALAALVASPAVAAAQESAVTETATADPGQLEDANIDRTILLPTAQTQPKGSIAWSDYELFFMGLSYGVTDDIQLTATALVPLADDFPVFAFAGVKARVVNHGPMRLALQGTLYYAREDADIDPNAASAASGGAIGSLCLDAGCGSLLTASATLVRSREHDSYDPGSVSASALVYGGSLVMKLSRRTKLLLEVATGADWQDGFGYAEGGLLSYGVRFFSGEIAGDVALVKPLGLDEDDEEFPLGFPFINFTYRAF